MSRIGIVGGTPGLVLVLGAALAAEGRMVTDLPLLPGLPRKREPKSLTNLDLAAIAAAEAKRKRRAERNRKAQQPRQSEGGVEP